MNGFAGRGNRNYQRRELTELTNGVIIIDFRYGGELFIVLNRLNGTLFCRSLDLLFYVSCVI
jgi:hypothetical protein